MVNGYINIISTAIIIFFITNIFLRIFKIQGIEIEFKDNSHLKNWNVVLPVLISIIFMNIYIIIFSDKFSNNNLMINTTLQIVLCSPIVLTMIKNRESLKSVGITKNNIIKLTILGFIIGGVYVLLNNPSLTLLKTSNYKKIIEYFVIRYMILIAFSEEFIYRGYLQTRLIIINGKKKGYLISTLISVLIHTTINIKIYGISMLLEKIIILIPLTLVLGYLQMETKSLIPGIILHAFADFCPFFSGTIY